MTTLPTTNSHSNSSSSGTERLHLFWYSQRALRVSLAVYCIIIDMISDGLLADFSDAVRAYAQLSFANLHSAYSHHPSQTKQELRSNEKPGAEEHIIRKRNKSYYFD